MTKRRSVGGRHFLQGGVCTYGPHPEGCEWLLVTIAHLSLTMLVHWGTYRKSDGRRYYEHESSYNEYITLYTTYKSIYRGNKETRDVFYRTYVKVEIYLNVSSFYSIYRYNILYNMYIYTILLDTCYITSRDMLLSYYLVFSLLKFNNEMHICKYV